MRRNEDRQGKRLLHSCSHIRATLVRMKHVRHSLGAISALLLASLLICGCSKPHVSGPVPGNASFNGLQFSLAPLGYQRNEYFLSGIATSYKPSGPLNDDGKWSVTPANTSPFTTRLVVIRPIDPAKFNGTILVEWLNVTSGGDAPAEWAYTHRELLRQGYAYVAVSAQQVGVEGGPSYFSGSKPLKQIDPARYAKLHLPGDAFSYDIFTQAGHLLRVNPAALLGPLKPQRLIAAGESQSAIFLTTYVNAIDPIAKVFDGFLLHSRFGFASGLNGSLDGSSGRGLPNASPVLIRDDVRVPVLMTVTETDLLSPLSTFLRVRQPDSNRIHTWEIAGTAHADNYVFGLGGTDSGLEPISQLASGFRAIDSIGGHKLDLITISFDENKMTLRVPVAQARVTGSPRPALRSWTQPPVKSQSLSSTPTAMRSAESAPRGLTSRSQPYPAWDRTGPSCSASSDQPGRSPQPNCTRSIPAAHPTIRPDSTPRSSRPSTPVSCWNQTPPRSGPWRLHPTRSRNPTG